MNVDDDNTTPLTNLGLSLGYFNRCFQTRLNDDSGASANAAASRVKMTFVANDPLSELVWSPHKGLRLKCADFSLDEERPSFLWGAGSSNTFFSPLSQSIFGETSNIDTRMEGKNKITTQDSVIMQSEVGKLGTTVISPTSDCEVMAVHTASHELNAGNDELEHMNTVVEAFVSDIKVDLPNSQMTGKSLDVNVINPPDESEPNIVSGSINKLIGSGPTNAGGDLGNQNLDISVSQNNSMKLCGSSNTPIPNKLSLGVNDQHLALLSEEEIQSNMKTIGSTGSPLEKVELTNDYISSHEVKVSSRQNEVNFPEKNKLSIGNSPSYSSFQRYRRKGKEKAVSDEDRRPTKKSEENEDSHESAESCNSVGLFPKGKKRIGFQQQLMIGTKRLKKQCQVNNGASPSNFQQDSSFMSWISNMMKVLPKSDNHEAPLALTITQSDHDHQKGITCKKIGDHARKNTGFQNIFRSLYCCDTKGHREIGTPSSEFQTNEGSNELEFVNNECDVSVTPIAFLGSSNMFRKQYFLENEKHDQSMSENVVGGPSQAKIPSLNLIAGTGPTCSSLGKRKNDSIPSSALEPHNNYNNKNDFMRSLWITRFCPKTVGPEVKLDRSNQVSNCLDTNVDRNLEAGRVNSSESPQNVASTDLQSCAANSEASFGLRGIKGHKEPKKLYRLNPDQASKRFKNSEAMASIFARRLDALKHILPSDAMGSVTRTTTTCFFCGVQGHDIRDCSKITEIELEDLLSSIHLYDGAEKSPCLCVKCFQLNHWAVACPNVMGNQDNTSDLKLDKEHERDLKMLETQESSKNIVANLSSGKQIIASSFEENGSKENPIPTNNFVSREIVDVPKGVSDSIKKLRLSRTDIFKCLNSQVPLTYLDGFFLRLRLGKWEKGLGGTGYYVGYIDGMQRENAPNDFKNPISVIIGGLKCSVESQYVSNHDFLEDEVTAWWSVTLKGGGKIPTQEDTRMKLEERKKIGL